MRWQLQGTHTASSGEEPKQPQVTVAGPGLLWGGDTGGRGPQQARGLAFKLVPIF